MWCGTSSSGRYRRRIALLEMSRSGDSPMSTTIANDKISEITSRMKRLPLTSYQIKALIIVGAATFFDAVYRFFVESEKKWYSKKCLDKLFFHSLSW
jgi:hypothetical protein